MKRAKSEKWAKFVIMLTGDASQRYRDMCTKAGADEVLYKPQAQEKTKEYIAGLLKPPHDANP